MLEIFLGISVKKRLRTSFTRLVYILCSNVFTSYTDCLMKSNMSLQYGPIVDIDMKQPPRPPGYCFVEVKYQNLILGELYHRSESLLIVAEFL